MQNVTSGTGGQVATDETDRLIASDKVVGTAVYNRQGERLGSVYNFMVDKRSGQVEYRCAREGHRARRRVDAADVAGQDLTFDRQAAKHYPASSASEPVTAPLRA